MRVKEEVKMFFEAKFKEQEGSAISLDGVPFASIDHNNNYLLVAKFLEEEMRQSIWECDGDKFPGLDDYNFHFIRSCWELLKDDILKVMKEFHRNEILPRGSNATILAHIPKIESPIGLNDYRPISLAC